MEAGADDFLAKPIDQGELRVRMHEGERIIRLERTLSEQNRQLRETQAALVQTEKLASLGQLAAGMAHEVNNPIAYVLNNLAVLSREVRGLVQLLAAYRGARSRLAEADPQLAAAIERQEAECDLEWIEEHLPRLFDASLDGLRRVRDIVKNLRDFARLDEADLDELDLNTALTSTIDVLQHEIEEKRIRVERDFASLPPILCRPVKINQVLYNVLLNAIQASAAEGAIRLRTKAVQDGVVVEVEDQGCGIDPSQLPRIFDPFFTTRSVGRGTGLGLAISYGIVRQHGGSIEVQSAVNRGSVFRIQFPLEPKRQEP
jgi:signal transduction histidine kinase